MKLKKVIRKVAAGLMVAAMVVTTVPYVGNENAAYAQVTDDDFEYSINDDDTVTIDGYTGSDSEIVIPCEIEGKSVTKIRDEAFSGCGTLTSVIIPDSVTSIGDEAFYGCDGLKDIYYTGNKSKWDSIDISSDGNENLLNATVHFAEEDIEDDNVYIDSFGEWTINEGENSISIVSFKGNGTDIVIPEMIEGKNVTGIEEYAFLECKEIKSITIPDSVTSIGNYAFAGCSGLISITIPKGITTIEECAFADCSGLTSVIISNGVTSIGSKIFSGCSGLTSITIPESVTSIGDNAFRGCSTLSRIIIPNSVTSIGWGAFGQCSGLTSITLPRNINIIDDYTFVGCEKLTSITIPESVKNIGMYAFSGCSGLTSITIPNSVTSIRYCTFYQCSGLTSITIPNSVTSIGYCAFYQCSGLKSITIPNSVTSIGYCAFYQCSGLTSITIPESVTNIKSDVFEECSELTSITISKNVIKIENSAFNNCNKLKDIYYSGSELDWSKIEVEGYNEVLKSTTIHFESDGPECTHKTTVIKNAKKATYTTYGYTGDIYCKDCGKLIIKGKVIPKLIPASIVKAKVTGISDTTYSDSLMTQTKLVVKLGIKTLKNGTDYTVSYKNNKSVGIATITIKGKTDYTGTITKTFTIKPKATSVSAVTSKKKAIAVTVKKNTTQTTGYEIQYGTKISFSNAKKKAVSNKTTKVTFSKLTGGKTYYIRVRTYKSVKVNGKTVKIYSAWSKAKSAKTKK